MAVDLMIPRLPYIRNKMTCITTDQVFIEATLLNTGKVIVVVIVFSSARRTVQRHARQCRS